MSSSNIEALGIRGWIKMRIKKDFSLLFYDIYYLLEFIAAKRIKTPRDRKVTLLHSQHHFFYLTFSCGCAHVCVCVLECTRAMVVFGQHRNWKELAAVAKHKSSYFIVMTFIAHLVICLDTKRITNRKKEKLKNPRCTQRLTKTKIHRQTIIRFCSRQMPQFKKHAYSDLCSPCAFLYRRHRHTSKRNKNLVWERGDEFEYTDETNHITAVCSGFFLLFCYGITAGLVSTLYNHDNYAAADACVWVCVGCD